MTKHQYLDELEAQLFFLSEGERSDAIREFESHIDDTAAARPDLSLDQVVERLPPPASVAARYYAETGDAEPSGPKPRAGEGSHGDGGRSDRGAHGSRGRGFSFGDIGSLFRFARREERELSGEALGVERVDISSAACDITVKAGDSFSCVVSGRWSDEDEPVIGQDGGAWSIRCGRDADSLSLVLPASVVELIASSASGDMYAELPEGASLSAKLASGDVNCRSSGGAVAVTTASGDVSVDGRPASAIVGTASGDISIRGAAGDVEAASQSGDIAIAMAVSDADVAARSMSGDVSISLASGARPAIRAESLSGDVSSPGTAKSRGPVGCIMEADGGPGKVFAKSVSGDISIS